MTLVMVAFALLNWQNPIKQSIIRTTVLVIARAVLSVIPWYYIGGGWPKDMSPESYDDLLRRMEHPREI